MALPSIHALAIYPVKDEPGHQLADAVVEADGLAGDRRKKRPVHLVGADVPPGQVRANVFCTVPESQLTGWVGREVEVGDAVLAVTELPSDCPGVYATVLTPGRIAVGQALRLRP